VNAVTHSVSSVCIQDNLGFYWNRGN